MSFICEEDVYGLGEGLMKHVWKEALGVEVETPFPRMTYEESMSRFGSDKPDMRFGLEIKEITGLVGESSSDMLKKAAGSGGAFAIVSEEGKDLSRKNIETLEGVARKAGAAGLAWGKVAGDKGSGMARFFEAGTLVKMKEMFGVGGDVLILIVAGERAASLKALGQVRLKLAELCDLVPRGQHRFVWITEFPLFEWDEEEAKWAPAHHMFSMPLDEDIDLLETEPGKVRARLYDLAYNGVELGSGSIRNHIRSVQERVMKVIGLDRGEAARRFGFLLEAFEYGAPPHGGIALGFDRIAMVLAGKDSIRTVIAFPKTTSGASLMDACPSEIDERDLRELHLKLDLPKPDSP
jgi:aspartyl-tRNA synthetase